MAWPSPPPPPHCPAEARPTHKESGRTEGEKEKGERERGGRTDERKRTKRRQFPSSARHCRHTSSSPSFSLLGGEREGLYSIATVVCTVHEGRGQGRADPWWKETTDGHAMRTKSATTLHGHCCSFPCPLNVCSKTWRIVGEGKTEEEEGNDGNSCRD